MTPVPAGSKSLLQPKKNCALADFGMLTNDLLDPPSMMPTGTEGSAVDSLTSALADSMDVVEAVWKVVFWLALHLNPPTGTAAQGLWQPEYCQVTNPEYPICKEQRRMTTCPRVPPTEQLFDLRNKRADTI